MGRRAARGRRVLEKRRSRSGVRLAATAPRARRGSERNEVTASGFQRIYWYKDAVLKQYDKLSTQGMPENAMERLLGKAADPARTHPLYNTSPFSFEKLLGDDDHAPLIFVNGADTKSAQMFTLAHELAHLWLGAEDSGLSGFPGIFPDGGAVETFCDWVAAEFLVPEAELRASWPDVRHEQAPFDLLERRFKVSPIVVGRRAMDLRLVERQYFFDFYEAYIRQERKQKQATGGDDFYNNQNARVGRWFATQVIRAAREGRIGFKQAYELTGLNGGAFQEYARRLGMELP